MEFSTDLKSQYGAKKYEIYSILCDRLGFFKYYFHGTEEHPLLPCSDQLPVLSQDEN